MTIDVQPTGAAVGARITGIDLRQDIDAKSFEIIHQVGLIIKCWCSRTSI